MEKALQNARDRSSDEAARPVTMGELLSRPFVTAKQAMWLIPCAHSKLYSLIGQGQLDVRKLGRRTLISTASIKKFHDGLPRAEIDRSDRAA